MGSNGGEHLNMTGNADAGCSETTVEIKIKTLDSQTFTLRVDKCVPVPQLKEQIASLTGVVSGQQRLICRGKVLNDDQLLSAYHVEDGHTLHLVVRQPVAPAPEVSDHPATDPTPNSGNNPRVMVGTFNLSDQADGAFPDLNRIVSAVLSSFGAARAGSGGQGIDLNQPTLASTVSDLVGAINSSRVQSDQAALNVDSLQPPIIPDALTTLLQYLNHLRQEFIANAPGHGVSGSDGQGMGAAASHSSEPRGILRPEALAEVMSSARQLIVEQATVSLSQLAGQLESHSSVMDPLERARIQSNAMRSGSLFQNLGALLLELGRAIMTLRVGQTPADALVNAGPAIFVSSTGPNPIMVQPLPFQPGASFGSIPVGSVQPVSGDPAAATTTGFLPRNIDIRIRTGSSFLSRREPSASSQPAGQGDAAAAATATADPASQQARAGATVPPPPLRPASSRGSSIGILYPVLARFQRVPSPGTRQPVSGPTDPAAQPQNEYFAFPPGGNGGNGTSLPTSEEAILNDPTGFSTHVRGGIEQLIDFFTSNSAAAAVPEVSAFAVPSHTTQEAARDTQEPAASASTSGVSDEGVILSNILRQIMPIISSQTTTNADGQTQSGMQADDGNNPDRPSSSRRHEPDHQSQQPDSKRQKTE